MTLHRHVPLLSLNYFIKASPFLYKYKTILKRKSFNH
jgi:hypothetical protein